MTTAFSLKPLFGLASRTEPNGHFTAWSYNSAGKVSSAYDNSGLAERYTYSILSHTSSEMNANGNSLTTERMLDSSGVHRTLSRQYFGMMGQPSTLMEGGHSTSGKYVYTATGYDGMGREANKVLPAVGTTDAAFRSFAEVMDLAQV